MIEEKSISFLFGSGFSAADGVPTVSDINEKLSGLREDHFYLGSDQRAFFYRDDFRDPNGWMSSSFYDRLFAQEFIAFYCRIKFEGDTTKFNYEEFYDFFNLYLRLNKNESEISQFCEYFRNNFVKDKLWAYDDHNFVWRFSKIFNQLISDILVQPKYYEDVSYINYFNYDSVLNFIANELENKIVNVHTLNHDILFDSLARKHTNLWQHYCDGFVEYGSPYYGEISIDHQVRDQIIRKNYKVRLKYFNNYFSKKLRLFKLHGSIDNYELLIANHPGSSSYSRDNSIRVKRDFAVREFLLERFDEVTEEYVYDRPFSENHPDYLTGTTSKVVMYSDSYYDKLFDNFKYNLKNTDTLIVIGYGFKDDGINQILIENYLSSGKKIHIVDIKIPDLSLFEKYKDQLNIITKSISHVSYEEFKSMTT